MATCFSQSFNLVWPSSKFFFTLARYKGYLRFSDDGFYIFARFSSILGACHRRCDQFLSSSKVSVHRLSFNQLWLGLF